MPIDELALWYADYESDPWGQERDDVSRALCAVAVCGHLSKSGVTVRDLMPKYGREPKTKELKAIEQEAAREVFRAWASDHNQRINGK